MLTSSDTKINATRSNLYLPLQAGLTLIAGSPSQLYHIFKKETSGLVPGRMFGKSGFMGKPVNLFSIVLASTLS